MRRYRPACFYSAFLAWILSAVDSEPQYVAIYEIDSPNVLLSKEWAEAVEKGRWPSEVRPFTSNRRHIVRKII
jgi:hypothetical protein